MKTLINVLVSIFVGICVLGGFCAGWTTHYFLTNYENTSAYCKDTETRTAWLSYRENEERCFLEHKEYPHRAKGYNIPHEPKNYYPTPIDFIQRELRPDFSEGD